MLPGEPRISVFVLREAVREEVERTSSHVVAREVGLSGPAIRSFVRGSAPRESNLRKYRMWYLRHRQRTGGTPDTETAAAALALLLEHVPALDRAEARSEFLDWIERISRQVGVEVPGWAAELRGGAGDGSG
jgi:hypothetical protein